MPHSNKLQITSSCKPKILLANKDSLQRCNCVGEAVINSLRYFTLVIKRQRVDHV